MRFVLALSVLGATCWSHAALAQNVAEKEIEVLHSFVTASETAAFKVIHDRFVEEGGKWIDSAMSGGGTVRATTVRRILGGDPPGAAQNQNKNIYQELLEGDYLKDITAVAEKEGWKEVLPPALYDSITYEGKIIAAPLQTQVANFHYATQETLDKLGVSMPKTFDELFAAMDKAKAAGMIAYAGVSETPDMRRLFTGSLAGIAGAAVYNKVYVDHDADTVKGPEFRKAAEAFKRLRSYSDDGWATREWNDSTALLVTGKAAFQITGDWGKGEFVAAGKNAGTDFQCGLLGGVVVIGGNVLIFPKSDDPGLQKAQDHLAAVAMAKDLQVPFAVRKGSIPTRTDVDTSSMDSCSQAAIAAKNEVTTSVLDDNYTVPPQKLGKVEDIIKSYWSTDMTTDQFVEQFAAAISE